MVGWSLSQAIKNLVDRKQTKKNMSSRFGKIGKCCGIWRPCWQMHTTFKTRIVFSDHIIILTFHCHLIALEIKFKSSDIVLEEPHNLVLLFLWPHVSSRSCHNAFLPGTYQAHSVQTHSYLEAFPWHFPGPVLLQSWIFTWPPSVSNQFHHHLLTTVFHASQCKPACISLPLKWFCLPTCLLFT